MLNNINDLIASNFIGLGSGGQGDLTPHYVQSRPSDFTHMHCNKLIKDQYTLIEQSNILLEQSAVSVLSAYCMVPLKFVKTWS